MKYVSPSVRETAFNCPHCGALTTQQWYHFRAQPLGGESRVPFVMDAAHRESLGISMIQDVALRNRMEQWADMLMTGEPSLGKAPPVGQSTLELRNVSVSECFNCEKLSVWIYDRLVHPRTGQAQPANPDLPDDIRRDYDEARSILDDSPRGAAALMRLAIQKLCKELGQAGENVNNDIRALVADGLDPQVQKALDAVRVIGNNAVHPGQIDLRDDRAVAETLFGLLNVIVEKTISGPKHIDEVYATLPEPDREAIAKRDGKA